MDWEAVLAELISTVAKIVVSLCIPYVAKLAKDKIHNDRVNKYVDKAANVIGQVVDYVNQTYVDGLKKEGKFGKEQQEVAFELSYDYAMRLINEESKKACIEMFGDFELWVNSMIESSVRNSISHIPIADIAEGVVLEDG